MRPQALKSTPTRRNKVKTTAFPFEYMEIWSDEAVQAYLRPERENCLTKPKSDGGEGRI